MVVIEDEDVRITRYLLRNVEFGGHLLVPMKHVNAVRAAGRYDCVGIIEVHGSNAVMRENIGPEFWKKSEVRTEEAFRNAKTDEIDSTVSYVEAQKTLDAAGRKVREGHVLEDYQQLIKDTRELRESHGKDSILRYTYTDKKGVTHIVPVGTLLPLAEEEYESAHCAVFRKRLA